MLKIERKAGGAAIDTAVAGEYVIDGVLEDGTAVTCAVEVAHVN